jgi:hypothetical protein
VRRREDSGLVLQKKGPRLVIAGNVSYKGLDIDDEDRIETNFKKLNFNLLNEKGDILPTSILIY